MHSDQKFLLGVSVDNVTLDETIEDILNMVEKHKEDNTSRYIATVNTDFIINANCWNWPTIYNPEFLSQLRHAALAVCDGAPLTWLSFLLSSPLKQRVAGASLLAPLAEAMAKKGYSIFLLGGTETEAQDAASALSQRFNLKIAGTASPHIVIEGPELVDEPEKDSLLIEQINTSLPDLLLINLGSPKQELWFSRVVSQLNVPVSIGVGGCFSFLSGSTPRAPDWMQKAGLEWTFRLYQEPKRLWKRYFFGFFQALYMAIPAIIYHQFCNAMYHCIYRFSKSRIDAIRTRLYVSSTRTIAVLQLPTLLNTPVSDLKSEQLEQAFTHDHIVVDFRHVRHMTLEGISFLVALWMRAQKEEKELSGLGLTSDMRLLLKMHRAWDVLSAYQHATVADLLTTLQQARYNTLYDTIEQDKKMVNISFFGKLDNDQNYERLFSRFEPILKERNCMIDLSCCTTIEGRGFSFLLRLKKHLQLQRYTLHVCDANPDVQRQFKRARISL